MATKFEVWLEDYEIVELVDLRARLRRDLAERIPRFPCILVSLYPDQVNRIVSALEGLSVEDIDV